MITSKELAKICGVSIGTIDRALHDRGGISAATKEKILRVSKELGYRPHLTARNLKIGKTMTVGVVVFDLDNQFFSQLLNSLVHHAREEGYFLHVTLSEHSIERELECLDHLVSMPVDGILIVPTNQGTEFTRFAKSLNVPIVSLGNRISASIPFVAIDDRGAMRTCVEVLSRKGYQKIIYVSPPLSYKGKENIYAVSERYAGYKEGARHCGMRPVVIDEKDALDKIPSMVRSSPERTAVLCSSDIYALKTLTALDHAGLRVPQDVGLMGFDDIDLLEYVNPPLTSVSQEIEQLAGVGFRVLRQLIEGDPAAPSVTLTNFRIVERQST